MNRVCEEFNLHCFFVNQKFVKLECQAHKTGTTVTDGTKPL